MANTATPTRSGIGRTKIDTDGSVTRDQSRKIETGHDWLDNNGVNILMAFLMSVGAMGIAQQAWGVDVLESWAQIVRG